MMLCQLGFCDPGPLALAGLVALVISAVIGLASR
jgi:hypothetical protein